MTTRLAVAAAKAAVDAVVDKLDTGTGANPKLYIYSGSQPAGPDTAINTGTNDTLCIIDLGTAAIFGNATTGTGADTKYAVATAGVLPKSDTSADASGTAAWFRAKNKSGTAIIDGKVGTSTSTAELALDSTTISAGQTVKLNSWKVKLQFKA